MQMEFSDLLSLYQASVDEVHRVWNYLGLASVGIVTVVWTVTNPGCGQLKAILAAFAAFAIGSGYLVYKAQTSRLRAAKAIKAYVGSHPENSGPDGGDHKIRQYNEAQSALLMTLNSASAFWVASTHAFIDVVVTLLILARYYSLGSY